MTKFKRGERVVIGNRGDQEKGTVLAAEADDMYIVEVDRRIDKDDDKLREVYAPLMRRT